MASKARPPPPALNPESCALVQPYKDFLGKGFLKSLTAEFNPMGTRVFCTLRADLLKEGEKPDILIAVGDAKQRIVDANLWVPGKSGTAKPAANTNNGNALPKKSLCKEDFDATDDKLSERALAVARALGDTTARGRIGSLKMMIEGVDTFEKWWSEASAGEKTRLLSDKKHHDSFAEEQHLRFGRVVRQCPFRGPVPTPSEEEEEVPEAPKPISTALTVQTRKGGKK